MSQRRRLLQGAAGTVVLSLAPHIARGASLLALRVWPAPEYTRVTIEHDGALRFHHFLLRDAQPLRLVVDIEGVDLTPQFAEQVKKVDPADPFIARIRAGQNRGILRLVLELKTSVDPQVFAVEPVGPYRNRLVLDLYPEGANDALMALLRSPPDGLETPPDAAPPDDAAGSKPPETGPATEPPKDPGTQLTQAPAAPADPAATTSASPGNADVNDPPRPKLRPMRRLITIAIDPGHGGEDPGAVGRHGTHEKDVTLSIGRILASLVQEQADYRVMLTRDSDYFVKLDKRVDKARRAQADLFVSIHADAWVRSDARGSSVFALSAHGASSSMAAELARQQNDADLIGGALTSVSDSTVRRVLLDLSTSAQISDSLRVGDAVLHSIEHVNPLHRGVVEQAGFAVLKAPTIPSILVETAFISNPDEEARLRDLGYQRQMAAAVFGGIRDYFAHNPPATRNPIG